MFAQKYILLESKMKAHFFLLVHKSQTAKIRIAYCLKTSLLSKINHAENSHFRYSPNFHKVDPEHIILKKQTRLIF